MQHTKARILHVDDHQDTRLMMAPYLNECGDAYLQKPVCIADIEATIARLLSDRAQR